MIEGGGGGGEKKAHRNNTGPHFQFSVENCDS